MWEFFINNNKFAYLFIVALIGVGVFSIFSIPRESAPEVVIPVGVITTVLPGAPAADVESLVTNEIERSLSGLEKVNKITSTSREGVSTIIVEFDAEADIDSSIQDLKDEIDGLATKLPTDAEDPFVSEVSFVDQPIMQMSISGNQSDFAFYEMSRELEKELEAIAGVQRIDFTGVRDRQVTVIVDQTALLLYSLTLSDVTKALQSANLTLPIGQIENNGVLYNIAFEGDITGSEEIPNVAITTKGGQSVFIRDVAYVEDGLGPATTLSRLSVAGDPSLPSIGLAVYKQSGGDITKVTRNVKERIAELQAPDGLLSDFNAVVIYDAGADILTDLKRLSFSGLQTVTLVIILLVIAIGWREGILAGTAIPLSFLFGFIGLYFSGNTINFLSLFSLILGIGILVDSAIVMVEGINRRMKDDPTIDKHEAAIKTIKEFRAPLISGTLTTVAMFAGLLVVSGVTGQFIKSIPYTLIFLLFASLFVSLFIIPLFATSFLHRKSATRMEQLQVEYAHKAENWYRNKLRNIIFDTQKENIILASLNAALFFALFLAYNVWAGLICAGLIFVTYKWRYGFVGKHHSRWYINFSLWLVTTTVSLGLAMLLAFTVLPDTSLVKVIFFEQSDIDFVIVEIEKPEGTTKEVTDIAARRVEEVLYAHPDISSFTVTVGSGNEFSGGGTGEKLANMFVNLDKDRDKSSTEIVAELRKMMSPIRDVKVTVDQLSDGPPTGAAIIIKYLGDDLTEITEFANQTAEIIRSIPNTTNVQKSTNNNSTEFVLELDKEKTAALGLNPFLISQLARTAVFGTDATSLTTLDEDVDVVVKLNVNPLTTAQNETTNLASIDDLTRITVPSLSGDIPLSELVRVSLRESSSVINHENGRRIVSVFADVTDAGNAREAQSEALRRVHEDLDLPGDIQLSTGGGETDESNKAFIEMFLALIVGVALMVGILTLQFNSYLHMRYVLTILPYSLIGIFVGLAITQSSLSFPSMMGFIALSGIVVNNSILLIDMMNYLRLENPEMPIREVVLDAAGNRLRPILLTMLTTVIGMIPLIFAGDLWSPLAYAVMFGLIFSVTITLVLIPIIYHRNPGKFNN